MNRTCSKLQPFNAWTLPNSTVRVASWTPIANRLRKTARRSRTSRNAKSMSPPVSDRRAIAVHMSIVIMRVNSPMKLQPIAATAAAA